MEHVTCADCGEDLGEADPRTGLAPDAYYDDAWDGDPLCEGCAEEARDATRYDDEEGGYDYDDDRSMFADPGGHSALRAATPDNPRDRPCPTCGRMNVLTPADVAHGYQCDRCADAAEGIGP